jgi:hypothetical protein
VTGPSVVMPGVPIVGVVMIRRVMVPVGRAAAGILRVVVRAPRSIVRSGIVRSDMLRAGMVRVSMMQLGMMRARVLRVRVRVIGIGVRGLGVMLCGRMRRGMLRRRMTASRVMTTAGMMAPGMMADVGMPAAVPTVSEAGPAPGERQTDRDRTAKQKLAFHDPSPALLMSAAQWNKPGIKPGMRAFLKNLPKIRRKNHWPAGWRDPPKGDPTAMPLLSRARDATPGAAR